LITINDITKFDKKPALRWLFVKMLGIQEGVLSNFPICCIAWYLVREDTLFLLMKKNDRLWEWYYKKIFQKKNKVRHIQCPVHWISKKKPVYFKCNKCRWVQLEGEECLKCLTMKQSK
jgi:hypothetical protein